jgi:predicted transcriptional regulator
VEHAAERKQKEPRSVAALTTEIVTAYVTRNTIAIADLGDLIGAVGRALGALGRESTEPAAAKRSLPYPSAGRSGTITSSAWSAASSRKSSGATSPSRTS